MQYGPHIAESADQYARLVSVLQAGVPSLTWEVDLEAERVTEEQWAGYLARLKAVLHSYQTGTSYPVRIRMSYRHEGQRYTVTLRLPMPDVCADFSRLCASSPPIGCWRVEMIDFQEQHAHRGPDVVRSFEGNIPF